MDIAGAVKWFFKSVAAVAEFLKLTQPSPEERKELLEIHKPLMEVKQRIKRENKIFNAVKNVADANIESAVREYTDLNEEDTQLLITNVTNRVNDYRRKHPVISGWRRFEKKNRK